MSKFSFDVLKRCVFPSTETTDSDVLLGAAFGEDVALTKVGGDILASHVDPIVGAVGNIGWLAVHMACNDIAASGIPPRWIQLLVLLPSVKTHAPKSTTLSPSRSPTRFKNAIPSSVSQRASSRMTFALRRRNAGVHARACADGAAPR
jgi:hypothetical protein